MTVRLFAFTCGWLEAPLQAFLADEPGRLRVPVPAYLVEHPGGRLLFDSGLHPSCQRDSAARLGEVVAAFYQVEFSAGQEIDARLRAQGVDPERIEFLVNSHLHFDHAGGNARVPNARLVLQRKEWEAARDPDLAARAHLHAKDWDHGHDVLAVDGEHDLFGDGSVVLIPTHGHTPGHQSLKLRLPDGEVVLAGDACYLRRTLEELQLPPAGVVFDEAAMRASLHTLRRLERAGARIFYGHDPEFWRGVPQAPEPVRG